MALICVVSMAQFIPANYLNVSSSPMMKTQIPARPRAAALVGARPGTSWAGGWISVRVAVRLRYGADLHGRVHIIAPGNNRLPIQGEQLFVLYDTFQHANRRISGQAARLFQQTAQHHYVCDFGCTDPVGDLRDGNADDACVNLTESFRQCFAVI